MRREFCVFLANAQRNHLGRPLNYAIMKLLGNVKVLTVVAVSAEEDVVADEVGPAAEVGALRDEHLLDEREAVDDDARRRAERDAEDVAVHLAQVRERLERHLVTGEQVERADDRPAERTGRRAARHLLRVIIRTVVCLLLELVELVLVGALLRPAEDEVDGALYHGDRLVLAVALARDPDEREREGGQRRAQDHGGGGDERRARSRARFEGEQLHGVRLPVWTGSTSGRAGCEGTRQVTVAGKRGERGFLSGRTVGRRLWTRPAGFGHFIREARGQPLSDAAAVGRVARSPMPWMGGSERARPPTRPERWPTGRPSGGAPDRISSNHLAYIENKSNTAYSTPKLARVRSSARRFPGNVLTERAFRAPFQRSRLRRGGVPNFIRSFLGSRPAVAH